jgi:hypothetical protein
VREIAWNFFRPPFSTRDNNAGHSPDLSTFERMVAFVRRQIKVDDSAL